MKDDSPQTRPISIFAFGGAEANDAAAFAMNKFNDAAIFRALPSLAIIIVKFQAAIRSRPNLQCDFLRRIVAGVLNERREWNDAASFHILRQQAKRRVCEHMRAPAESIARPKIMPRTRRQINTARAHTRLNHRRDEKRFAQQKLILSRGALRIILIMPHQRAYYRRAIACRFVEKRID